MGVLIRQVRDDAERIAVFRFRYAVYVEEMRRSEKCADSKERVLAEPLDQTGRIFAAFDESGNVVGTARLNFSRDSETAEYEGWYGMRAFSPYHPEQTVIVTKLMVAPARRRSTLAVRLACACYDLAVREGIAFGFIDCNPHLKQFFEGLGFFQMAPDFIHPQYGAVHPLVMALWDRAHFQRVGSPFAPPRVPEEHPSVYFMHSLTAKAGATVS